jgi:hypothetical protein
MQRRIERIALFALVRFPDLMSHDTDYALRQFEQHSYGF